MERYFTDQEYRLLLSALSRETEICKQVDKSVTREHYETSLEYKMRCIQNKIEEIQYGVKGEKE